MLDFYLLDPMILKDNTTRCLKYVIVCVKHAQYEHKYHFDLNYL